MFTTSVLRPSIKIGAITSSFEVAFFVSEQKKEIIELVWFINREQLPVFRRQIRQGCGLITFSVTGIKRRGIISICYDGT